MVNALESGSRGRGFEPHSGQTVLCPFKSKAHLLPKSTGNTSNPRSFFKSCPIS